METHIQELFTVAQRKAELLHQFSQIYSEPDGKREHVGRPRLKLTEEQRAEHVREIRRRCMLQYHERMKRVRAINSIKSKFTILTYKQQSELIVDLIKMVSLK